MGFIYFILGILIGMAGATVFFMAALLDKSHNPADNAVATLQRVAIGLASEKGAILYPKTEETIAMEDLFERNDKKGRDTEIGKILEGNDD